MLVEVSRKAFLASLVPVIVNSILNEHQIIVDIVAFVSKGVFPRSRLGEKQRGKILAGWVSRKMSTIAQWAIKDMDAMHNEGPMENSAAAVAAANELHRVSISSHKSSGGPAIAGGPTSSLRNTERAAQIPEQRELEHAFDSSRRASQSHGYGQGPGGHAGLMIAEMSADFPPGADNGSETTPTRAEAGAPTRLVRSPSTYDLQSFENLHLEDGSTSGLQQQQQQPYASQSSGPPQLRLPGVDGRESMDWDDGNAHGGGSSHLGVVRDDDGEDWSHNAMMHMNLAGGLQRKDD